MRLLTILLVFNGASSTWWLDGANKGTLSVSPGSNQAVGFTLGARYSQTQNSHVWIAAICINNAVPAAGMAAVQSYFMNIWGTMGVP